MLLDLDIILNKRRVVRDLIGWPLRAKVSLLWGPKIWAIRRMHI